MSKDAINQRFKTAINFLIKEKIAKNKQEISNNLNISASRFSEILNLRMNVQIDLLAILSEKYNVSVDYIINGNNGILKNPNNNKNGPCIECQQKNKIIEILEKQVKLLEKHIETIETIHEQNNDSKPNTRMTA
jgi:transcriptional regulator with XRE-family HTH domain